jgi:hypothetical protein
VARENLLRPDQVGAIQKKVTRTDKDVLNDKKTASGAEPTYVQRRSKVGKSKKRYC